MRRKSIIILILIISASCIGLTLFLAHFFCKEYKREAMTFHLQIENVMYGTIAKQINEVPSIDFQKLDTLIKFSLYENVVSHPSYSWGVISHKEKKYIHISDSACIQSIIVSPHKYDYLVASDTTHSIKNRYSIVMYFPNEAKYILSRIFNFLFVSVSLLILIITAFIFSIIFIFRQKKISEQKNDYINHMTHEVKTPVATTLLAIEALNDKAYPCNEEMRTTYLNIILKEILRLQELVLQILNRARKENMDNTIQKELLHIHPIIEEAVESMSLRAKEKGGIIQSSLEAKNTEIYGSPVHITNIIMNLMENAIKYTPQSPCIQVSTLNTREGIEIRIQDNGIGIAEKDQKKIFKKYYRASNSPNKESFGVGLNYVQHVVKLHKGNIQVESELGKGSTFIIYLKTV